MPDGDACLDIPSTQWVAAAAGQLHLSCSSRKLLYFDSPKDVFAADAGRQGSALRRSTSIADLWECRLQSTRPFPPKFTGTTKPNRSPSRLQPISIAGSGSSGRTSRASGASLAPVAVSLTAAHTSREPLTPLVSHQAHQGSSTTCRPSSEQRTQRPHSTRHWDFTPPVNARVREPL